MPDQTAVLDEVRQEYQRAAAKFPAFNSAHEGFAVLTEEVWELWQEVITKDRSTAAMRTEAVQVAAMALRFIVDVCERKAGNG